MERLTDSPLTGVDAFLYEWKKSLVFVISVGEERADVCARAERRPCKTDLITDVSRRHGITETSMERHEHPSFCEIEPAASREWPALGCWKEAVLGAPRDPHGALIVPLQWYECKRT